MTTVSAARTTWERRAALRGARAVLPSEIFGLIDTWAVGARTVAFMVIILCE